LDTTHGSIEHTADREIVATRVFDAPRDLVFRMWTDPAHIMRWWGPNGFTTTIHEMDVRPGGMWRFIMHGPDGVDYPNEILYREIMAPERLAYAHVAPAFETTVTFAEERGRTTVRVRMLFGTAAERDAVLTQYGAVEGLNQTLGRLDEYLAAKTVGSPGR